MARADSTIPRSEAPGHANPYSSVRYVVSQEWRTKGPGRECDSLGRLGDKGNYFRFDSFMFADDLTGVSYREGNLNLTLLRDGPGSRSATQTHTPV